jgi:hypothetical protein
MQEGLNTSALAPRVVEGDEKERGAWGYDWATLSLGDIYTETWCSRLGVGRKVDDLAL